MPAVEISRYEYELPRELIAQQPLPCRADARLLVITTDHGAVRVNNPVKVIGDRQTSVNLRYKQGQNLNYNKKEVFEVTKPESIYLPRTNVRSSYIFAMNNDFMVYPNNYNHFVNLYRNTFQHGGISMEEMLIPISILSPVR